MTIIYILSKHHSVGVLYGELIGLFLFVGLSSFLNL